MSFFTRLERRVREVDSLLCIGLDAHSDDLAESSPEGARDFCFKLIDATSAVAAAFKPNIAFFEAYGGAGLNALKQVIGRIPDTIPVILDAKRGDIASTAEAYARAIFEELGAQAMTVNPYLGHDALQPFLSDPEKGVFLLCKTSNPGASDLQDLIIADRPGIMVRRSQIQLYEKVALLAQEWNQYDNLGLVVGATQPEALQRVRQRVPDLWILAPGVGVQGGDLSMALDAGLRADGSGVLISVARGISRSADPKNAAIELHRAINEKRTEHKKGRIKKLPKIQEHNTPGFEPLADGLLDSGCIKFGQYTLKSGMVSPIYIDLRQLVSYPELLELVAEAYLPILDKLRFDRIAGLPYAAVPIATAISLQTGWPFIYPRKEAKPYGTKAEIEGYYRAGEQVVIIDDLATTGESKFESIEKLTSAGLKVQDIVVLVDRQSGAPEALSKAGYTLHSVFTLTNLLNYFEKTGKVSVTEIKAARDFINSSL